MIMPMLEKTLLYNFFLFAGKRIYCVCGGKGGGGHVYPSSCLNVPNIPFSAEIARKSSCHVNSQGLDFTITNLFLYEQYSKWNFRFAPILFVLGEMVYMIVILKWIYVKENNKITVLYHLM